MNNQNAKRGRHRNNNSGGRRGNPGRQNFDSNGPGVRIRGNASQIHDKYVQLARDAQASGDRILAESMLQYAEHYYRILNADQAERANRQSSQGSHDRYRGRRPENDQSDSDGESSEEAVVESTVPAPAADTGADAAATPGEDGSDDTDRRRDSRRSGGSERRTHSRRGRDDSEDAEGRDALARHLGTETSGDQAANTNEGDGAADEEPQRKPRRGRPKRAADADGTESKPRKQSSSRSRNGGRQRRYESNSEGDPELPLDLAPSAPSETTEPASAE